MATERNRRGRPIANIEPETEERLEQAYGPAEDPPVKMESIIGRHPQSEAADPDEFRPH